MNAYWSDPSNFYGAMLVAVVFVALRLRVWYRDREI